MQALSIPVNKISGIDTIPKQRLARSLTKSRERRIRFRPTVEVFAVPNIREAAKNGEVNVSALWYSRKEFTAIRGRARRTVVIMRELGANLGDSKGDVQLCIRGLEFLMSDEVREQRAINKDTVIVSVLNEQERQRQAGINDIVALSLASRIQSRWATNLAISMGSADAAIFAGMYKDSRISADGHCRRIIINEER